MKSFAVLFISMIFSLHSFCQHDTLSTEDLNYRLLIASYYGITDSILYWLNAGADVNSRSDDGITALNYAIQSNNAEAAKILIANGADVNYHSYYALPPLFMAVAYNQLPTVEFLLKKGANTSTTIKNKVTILHYAIKFADTTIIKLLIEKNNKLLYLKDDDGNSPLMVAIYFHRYDVVQFLCQSIPGLLQPDEKGITPLLLAVLKADTTLAEQLIRCGASITETSYNGYGIVEYALLSRNNDVLSWAIRKTNKQSLHSSLIKLAYVIGDRSKARLFRKAGAKPHWGFILSNLNIGTSHLLGKQDYMFGISSQITEYHYGINISLEYSSRLWANRILLFTDEPNVFIQAWERRSLLGFSATKHIRLLQNKHNKLFMNIGATSYFTYGKYRGFEEKPASFFLFTPILQLNYQMSYVAFSISAEYFKFKDVHAAPLHIKLTQYFTIPLNNYYIPKKQIVW